MGVISMSAISGAALPKLTLIQGLGQSTTGASPFQPATSLTALDGYTNHTAYEWGSLSTNNQSAPMSGLTIHSPQPVSLVVEQHPVQDFTQETKLLQAGATYYASASKDNETTLPKPLWHKTLQYLAYRYQEEGDNNAENLLREFSNYNSEKARARRSEKKNPKEIDPKEALKPLESVFLNRITLKEMLRAFGVRDLVRGETTKRSGGVLIGPPGTGKTISLRAIAKVYENYGGYAEEISEAGISDKFVGSKAKNLDEIIQKALEEAEKRGVPSFIFMDEATASVSKPDGSSVSNYYQEALDTLKRYIGNYPGKLVFAISTNENSEKFEEALIREGRMQVILMDYPELKEKVRMWKHFLAEFGLTEYFGDIKEEDYVKIAGALPNGSQGAAIFEFCNEYLDRLIESEEEKRSDFDDPLRVLQNGPHLTIDDVKDQITVENFIAALQEYHEKRHSHKDQKTTPATFPQRKRITGFDTTARKKTA